MLSEPARTGHQEAGIGGQQLMTIHRASTTRLLAITAAAALALTACADGMPRELGLQSPMGQSEFHRSMRDSERAGGRSGRPYSVPPERGGAPLAPPMAVAATPPPAEGSSRPAPSSAPAQPARPAAQEPAPRDTTIADQQRFDPDEPRDARASQPASGEHGTVPLVRVNDSSADGGPNIIAYALNTTHAVGTERYPRRNPLRWQLWERNCLQFADQNTAQEAFLAAGGPERDRNNLDPVGDGFACWWDPEPIRRAARAND